jgi:hypothetical protein
MEIVVPEDQDKLGAKCLRVTDKRRTSVCMKCLLHEKAVGFL